MRLHQLYRGAIKVCERLGTWVLYATRDARDLEHLIGYMAYTVDDLETLKGRTESEARRALLSKQIGHWRRAIRWVSGLDRSTYGAIAERLLEMAADHPEDSTLPYVAKDSGHRSLSVRDRPPSRAGRPRTTPVMGAAMKLCQSCDGLGFKRNGA